MLSINKYSSYDILNWKTTNVICLYIKIENNKLIYKKINTNFEDRALSILNMIKDTLSIHKVNDVEIYINLMDIPLNNPYFLHFSRTTNCPINTIPNFSLYEWKDIKISNFFTIRDTILNNQVNWDDKLDKIMWSGSSTFNIRVRMNDYINTNKNDMYVYNLYDKTNIYYELKDHSKYKYLLDMEGVGYSGRFPYLALTGSCVILIENSDHDRDYKLYYDEHFIEDIHYVKVRYNSNDNISDINKRILDKINDNDCKKIGEACKQVAINLFTKDNILLYFAKILNYYAEHYEKSTTIYNPELIYNFKYFTNRLKKLLFNKYC